MQELGAKFSEISLSRVLCYDYTEVLQQALANRNTGLAGYITSSLVRVRDGIDGKPSNIKEVFQTFVFWLSGC